MASGTPLADQDAPFVLCQLYSSTCLFPVSVREPSAARSPELLRPHWSDGPLKHLVFHQRQARRRLRAPQARGLLPSSISSSR